MISPPERVSPPWKLLVCALALRIALMPVALHSDLFFVQYFPTFLSLRGHWDVYGFLGDHFLARGFTYYPPMVLYTIASFQKAFAGLAPDFPRLMGQFHALFYGGADTGMPACWAGFTVIERMGLTAWMKLPYLAADAVIAAVLLRGWSGVQGRRALQLWCWSPVALYGVYLFGQYRNISCAVMILALWMSREGKEKRFFFLLGIAALYENFVWVLIPFILLVRVSGARAAAVALICYLAAPIIVLTPLVLSSGPLSLYSYASPLITKAASTGILRSYPHITPVVCKILLAACLSSVCLAGLLWRRRRNMEPGHRSTVLVCIAVLFAIYATSVTMVHYFLWVMPFLLIDRAERPSDAAVGRVLPLMTALLFVFNLDSSGTLLGLLSPLDPSIAGPPSLHEALAPYAPWGKVIAISRLTFSGLCFYVVIMALSKLRTRSIDPASATGV